MRLLYQPDPFSTNERRFISRPLRVVWPSRREEAPRFDSGPRHWHYEKNEERSCRRCRFHGVSRGADLRERRCHDAAVEQTSAQTRASRFSSPCRHRFTPPPRCVTEERVKTQARRPSFAICDVAVPPP